ncbi:MAG: alpha/beta fold hydrolase [Candidatus Lambdaproteobacteria bacterium]|nr:alpha/beta fold hydrolase [Candidatus Lambdaproteobacteria bacterium]
MLLIAAVLLALSGCNSVFFQPNRRLYFTPEQFNLAHEEVRFRSADGAELHGWFLPGRSPVRGTIVHFHGNAANVTNHLYAVRWLPPEGFSVFLFDYRGYGESEGSPSREGAIADGEAAIRYVRGRPDVEPERLIVYGQSLGGALAVGALARAGIAGVKALVIEGGFASYREEVRLILDSTWLTWPFQYPVAYLLFSDALRPLDDLPRIADVPLLVIHGQTDATVRIENGLQLYEAFPGKTKAFWAVPGADHMEVFSRPESPWRTRLLAYLRAAVDGSAP